MKERGRETRKLQEIRTTLSLSHLGEETDPGGRGVRPSEVVPFPSQRFKAREDVS